MRLIALALFLMCATAPPAAAQEWFGKWVRNAATPGTWHAQDYAEGSQTGGIVEALAACAAGGGGTVEFRQVEIDATGRQSPLISTPVLWSDRRHKTASPCHLVGYGSDGSQDYKSAQQETNLAALGSALTVHNMAAMIPNEHGEKIVLAVPGSSQVLQDFSIRVGGLDDASRCIVTQGGRQSIAEITIERVVCAGDTHIGVSPRGSIGLDLQATMRSRIVGGTFRNFGTGIEFGNMPEDLALKNNSNYLSNLSARSNYVGIAFRTWHACSEVTLDEVIIESNERGIVAEDNAACRVLMNGGHFEQVPRNGISNIENHTAATQFVLVKTYFGGKPGCVFDDDGARHCDGWDYIRTRQATGFGFDVFTGVQIGNGIHAQRGFVQLIEPFYVARARGYVGAGDSVWHPSNCERHLRISQTSTQGRECRQMNDGSTWRAVPQPGLGREGVADMPGEVECVSRCIGGSVTAQ